MLLQNVLEVFEFIGSKGMTVFAENLKEGKGVRCEMKVILGHRTLMMSCCLDRGILCDRSRFEKKTTGTGLRPVERTLTFNISRVATCSLDRTYVYRRQPAHTLPKVRRRTASSSL
jgi:hypothetical protein